MDLTSIGSSYIDGARFDTGAIERLAGRGAAADGAGAKAGVSFADMVAEAVEGERPDDGKNTARVDVNLNAKLYEQCQELETFIVKILMKGMRSTVQKSGLIDTGFAGGMYEDMLYDEYAKSYSKNANFGLAEMAYAELTGTRGSKGAHETSL
jgi:flagellar protein FlgJ